MTIPHLRGRDAPRSKRSAMETQIFTREEVLGWKLPSFQRPLRVNSKVLALTEEIKGDGGIIPGVLTLGRVGADKAHYIVDGQHRVEAFKISELDECIADVRSVMFDDMAEMADEFVNLNSRLVNMRPDDILRGLEESMPLLRRIREACDFVSYGQIRRGTPKSPVIGMSLLLRAWHISAPEVPASTSPSAAAIAAALDDTSVNSLIAFMQIARSAWGADPENYRLWGSLNVTINMWIYRRHVLDKERSVKRAVAMTPDQFRKCLMSVAADSGYAEWLVGRNLNERDRSPCYSRLKIIFTRRLQQDTQKKVTMVQPSWASR
jgi:hypothetical protein